jgi:hypothetical protein
MLLNCAWEASGPVARLAGLGNLNMDHHRSSGAEMRWHLDGQSARCTLQRRPALLRRHSAVWLKGDPVLRGCGGTVKAADLGAIFSNAGQSGASFVPGAVDPTRREFLDVLVRRPGNGTCHCPAGVRRY